MLSKNCLKIYFARCKFQNIVSHKKIKCQNLFGVIAQLGERLNGIQEVGGSIPLNSTMILLSFLLTNIFTFFIKFYVKYM
jgi:hypothetical protein